MSRGAGIWLSRDGAALVAVRKRGTEAALVAAALVPPEAVADALDDVADEAAGAGAGGAPGPEVEAAALKRLAPAAIARGVRAGSATLAISGRDAILRYMFVPIVPPWRLRLIMEYETGELAAKGGDPITCDWRILTIPEEIKGPAAGKELPVLVGMAKDGPVEARLAALARLRLPASAVLPAPIALFNAFVGLGHAEDGKTSLLVDVGSDGLEIVLERDGFLVFARSVSMDVARTPETRLVEAIASSLKFAKEQQKLRAAKPDRVFVSGARPKEVKGLVGALGKALGAEPTVLDPTERLDLSGLAEDVREEVQARGPSLAIAVGLALAPQHLQALDLDLLPAPVRRRREFRTRTVFMYAAAAALAVALGFGLVRGFVAKASVESRAKELAKLKGELEARRADLEALGARNARDAAALDALATRSAAGPAALRLLDRLREATPGRVSVGEMALDAQAGLDGLEAGAAEGLKRSVGFRLRGEVDNAAGDASLQLDRFVARLRAEPEVALVRQTSTPVMGPASLSFTLAVRLKPDAGGRSGAAAGGAP